MRRQGIEKSKTTCLVMRCNRCKKRLKKAYTYKGLIYGPECVAKVGGYVSNCGKVIIKDAESEDMQIGLFDEQSSKETDRKDG